jgi:hypothetical protein
VQVLWAVRPIDDGNLPSGVSNARVQHAGMRPGVHERSGFVCSARRDVGAGVDGATDDGAADFPRPGSVYAGSVGGRLARAGCGFSGIYRRIAAFRSGVCRALDTARLSASLQSN